MPWLAFVTALTFFLGAVVLLLPTIANWFSQVAQAAEIAELAAGARDLGAESLHEAITAAEAYNHTLTGGAVVGAGERIPQSSGGLGGAAELDYDQLLLVDATGLMARIRIPVIGVDLPIYHGTDDATLAEGVGHLEGTALPVGGPGTRAVLTAHRGLATSELFTHLDQVAIGDTFTIEVFGEVLTYRVVTTEVVLPDDSQAVDPVPGRDLVTLVTCTPLGINSHRILVTGERVLPTPVGDVDNAGGPPTIPGFPWWIFVLAGVTVVLTCYVAWSGRGRAQSPGTRQNGEARRDGLAGPGRTSMGIDDIVDKAKEFAGDAVENTKEFVGDAVDNTKEFVGDVADKVKDATHDAAAKIADATADEEPPAAAGATPAP
jgi:sortase A